MARGSFTKKVFSKELLWAGAGGAIAYGGYYAVGKFMPSFVSDVDQNKATAKQIGVAALIGLGGAYVASEIVKAPKGVAQGMVGMAGTLAAVSGLIWFRSRQGAVAGLNYLPGPMPSATPGRDYAAVEGVGTRGLIAGTGISTMSQVSEVRVRDNPQYVPQGPGASAALRAFW